MQIAYFCADFDSPYKPYFRRQVRGFLNSNVTVLSWGDCSSPDGDLDRIRIPTNWDQEGLGTWLGRKLRRVGCPVGLATAAETSCIRNLMESVQADVALLHSGFVAARVAPALRRLGIPYAIQCHGGDVREAVKIPGWGRMFASVCRTAAVVLVVGRYMIDELQGIGVPRSLMLVEPMGAPVRDRVFMPCPHVRLPFVVVGRLVPCKSIETVIHAVASTPEESGVSVNIIGDGPCRHSLEQLCRARKVVRRVKFMGVKSQAEVAREIDCSSGLVIATVDEPGGPEAFGVVCTEAMAAARPVLASRCGGLVDQVVNGETGFLFNQRDHLELGRAMLRLIKDPAGREKMGLSGRKRALVHFDSSLRAAAVEDLLHRLIA